MLVHFIDSKGADVWINPVHVKLVKQKRGITQIIMQMTSNFQSTSIKVRQTAEETAAMLNAAMPNFADFVPDDDSTDDGGAAAAVAMMG